VSYDLVIRNAALALGSDEGVDISVSKGVIRSTGLSEAAGTLEVDAQGALVTPGGVDPHCHMAQISSTGVPTADDINSGTVSAVNGGTTTVAAFAVQHRGDEVRDVAAAMIARVASEAVTDVALHMILTELGSTIDDDLEWLIDHGITSLKIFTTYDRLRLAPEAVIGAIAAAGKSDMQVMIHAEHDGMITDGRAQAIAAGLRDARGHQMSHTRQAERAGVAEALAIGEYADVPIYLVHVSTSGSLDEIRSARSRGVRVTVETCPHYLWLDESLLAGDLTSTAAFMSSPPLRGAHDRAALWAGLADGDIDIVASDHAPYRMDGGKLPDGADTVFTGVANGMPGVEMRMPLMMSAVAEGRLSLNRVLELCCSNPAESLGIAPNKGRLEVGSDADLVIWDVGSEREVRHSALHDQVDYTPYEGVPVMAWPDTVIYRGRVVGPDPVPGSGRFLKRTVA
jgi:dihydropyrimidinase